MTWVPWTHGRLASWQGYGAGVRSPGWYHHLFTAPDRTSVAAVAGRGRPACCAREGLPVSSAHVIEAVRLAEALATLRGRPLRRAGRGHRADPGGAVRRRRRCGWSWSTGGWWSASGSGAVPDDTPGVPLGARPGGAASGGCGCRPSPLARDLDLDLRRDIDLDRSRLLHRLRLLGVDWGAAAAAAGGGKGTFWESWRLGWQPEFAVDLVEASGYGTTVRGGRDRAGRRAGRPRPTSLAEVTALVERCLLADLPDALPAVLAALDERVALDADVAHLMDALPALARTLRYGDVRGTDCPRCGAVTDGLVTRICVGPAGGGRPASTTRPRPAMRDRIDAVHAAIALLDDADADRAVARRAGAAVRPGRPARAARRPAHPAAARRRPARRRRGGPAAWRSCSPSACRRPGRPPGSRASSPAAGCCWSTTSGCCGWSTPG